jgi:NAD(P)-dependent dehydrogenase (short-subunit alcohol dehydrogenase family)
MSPLPSRPRVVVTGAGGGLGRALCHELARRGARIVASDLVLADAQATVARLGAEAWAVRCDVGKLDEVEALAAAADAHLGGVDLVINNAGVAVVGRVGEVPLDDWRWIIDINLWGVIHGCHVFVPRLRRQGAGHVLNVASAAGLLAPPTFGPYNVTKAAVVALSETLHAELAGDGVGVSVLCPMFFRTNIARAGRGVDARMTALFEKLVAAGKLTADDVARAALDGVDAGRLYVVPQAHGRWLWRAKRLLPTVFHALAPRAVALEKRRMGIAE